VNKYLPFTNIPSKKEIQELLQQFLEPSNGLWIVSENNTIVWFVDIMNIWNGIASLAYVVWSRFSGRWIATKAIKEIIEISFQDLNFNIIQAPVVARNIWSQRVLQKKWF